MAGFFFNFLNLEWWLRMSCNLEWLSVLSSTMKSFIWSAYFMVILEWLHNSFAAFFSCWVSNVRCFLWYLSLMVSVLGRSQNLGLIEINFLSQSFKIFWYTISYGGFINQLLPLYIWMNIYIYVRMYEYTYICIHEIYIYRHTQTHTHTHRDEYMWIFNR